MHVVFATVVLVPVFAVHVDLAFFIARAGAPALVLVVALVPRSALAEPEQGDVCGPRELEDVGVARECIERLDEKRLEVLAHPDHDVRVLESLGVGRTEREGMRRGSSPHQENRPPHSFHDPCEQ